MPLVGEPVVDRDAGIIAALVLRAVFIALGAALLAAFSFMFLIFGLLLIGTAVQLFRHRDEDPSIEGNAFVRFARRRMPFTDEYDGERLFTQQGAHRVATPLVLVVLTIGSTDILFALDSIPAVFGVTEEPFTVFTANAFALLGLRALYFLVTGLLDRLVYLSTGLRLSSRSSESSSSCTSGTSRTTWSRKSPPRRRSESFSSC